MVRAASLMVASVATLVVWASVAPADAPRTAPMRVHTEAADTYRVYVANESSDLVSRAAFVPGQGAFLENEIPVGIQPGDIDGAHGITVSPDGRYWYVTIAHGTPYGSVWQFHAGPDTLVAMTELGLFPATMGISPDGRFLLAVNFNLHGDMVPSDMSVVYTPDMKQVARVETCLMPHGSRVDASGDHVYSVCMHSDQLVRVSLGTFGVTDRFVVTPGREGALSVEGGSDPVKHPGAAGGHPTAHGHEGASGDPASRMAMGPTVCSPTWAEPGQGVGADRFVYVACNKNAEVLEVDVESWTVARRFATGPGPYNLDVTPDGRRLVATLKGGQAIAVFDLEEGTELGRLETSRGVTHGVVISPDGRYAFVTNESVGSIPGTLDVFDLEGLERVATLELAHQSGGIDFWPGGGS